MRRRASHVNGSSPSFASVAEGVGHNVLATHSIRFCGPLDRCPIPGDTRSASPSLALGVAQCPPINPRGDDEEPFSSMRSSNVTRAQAEPFRIVPDGGKAREYAIQSVESEFCDVLHDDEARSKLANDSEIIEPEP
jgi:hypothetical protein